MDWRVGHGWADLDVDSDSEEAIDSHPALASLRAAMSNTSTHEVGLPSYDEAVRDPNDLGLPSYTAEPEELPPAISEASATAITLRASDDDNANAATDGAASGRVGAGAPATDPLGVGVPDPVDAVAGYMDVEPAPASDAGDNAAVVGSDSHCTVIVIDEADCGDSDDESVSDEAPLIRGPPRYRRDGLKP